MSFLLTSRPTLATIVTLSTEGGGGAGAAFAITSRVAVSLRSFSGLLIPAFL
jgi:hypothetical protein